MAVRRTCQDLINNYRAARKARDPDRIQRASIELGAALKKRGVLLEDGPRPGWGTIWQPVEQEGGKPGFAFAAYRMTACTMAPAYAWPKPKTRTRTTKAAGPKARTRYQQFQPA